MKKFLFSIICALLPIIASAQEPYAVLSEDNFDNVLIFYFDDQKATRGGMDVGPFNLASQRGWDNYRINRVVFDGSFANCTTITSTSCWFYGVSMTTITGLENLKTDNVTDMSSMFTNCSGLTSLDVSGFNTSNVTNMDHMFSGCSGLTSLDVSGFITENVTDMHGMFQACSSLTSLDVSGFNTANVTDMGGMFSGCSGLTSLDVSGFSTSNVTNMDNMFSGCSGLTSLDLSGFNTENVTDMSYMFSGCSGLTNLDLSGFNTENVTNMQDMFSGCSSLTSLDISGFNTGYVTSMYSMFSGCSGLTSLDVSGFNTSDVINMNFLFSGCSGLTSLDLNGFNTENVRYMSNMFEKCSALTNLNLSGFNTEHTSYMDAMFYDCSALTTINVDSNWTTDNVSHSNNMFFGCLSIIGGAGTTYDENHIDRTYAHIDGGELNPGYFTASNSSSEASEEAWAQLQSTIEHGTEVLSQAKESGNIDQWMVEELEMFLNQGNEMYKEHTASEEEVRNMIEDLSWRIREVEEAMKGGGDAEPYAVLSENNTVLTFYYDNEKDARGGMDVGPFTEPIQRGWDEQIENIESVVFSESFANCSSITSTAYWFAGLSNLKTFIGLEYLNTSNVTNMSNMFNSCSGLTSLNVSGFNTAKVTAMSYMFQNCHGLTSLDVSGFITENVTDMSYMFNRCSGLTSLNVSGFNTAKVTKMEGMFMECYSLKSLDLSGFNTSNVTAMPYMFLGCTALTTIYVSSDWATDNVEEGNEMFGQCTALVGGAGTKYDENHIDHTYAHIDGGTSNPGYLTSINGRSEAYFQNYTAYVYGNATLDDAFAEIGRETAIQSIAAIVWDADNALTADMLSGINNPNLLVFVTEALKAPAGVQNVVINGVAEEIILTDATGNNNFYCPQSFKAQSISYSRDFSQTTELEVCRGWETIALPFDVQNITHESHGALVPFAGGNSGYHFWLRQLSENGLMSAAQIEANKPYLISMPNNSIYPSVYNQNGKVTFSASDATVPETTPQSDSYAGVTLYATFQQVAQGSSVYALNVGEARGEYPEGSVFEQSYRDIRPFQAYTTHTAGTRGIITLESLGGNDNTTGIEEIRMNSELRDSKGPWYSLDGRRLDAEPTKKGIYVKDGRKIVIK